MCHTDTGACISNSTATSFLQRLASPSTSRKANLYNRLTTISRRKSIRRHAVRAAFLAANIALLGTVGYFVTQNPQAPQSAAMVPTLSNGLATPSTTNPLDQLSSANIALTIARLNNLPETTAITNQADSQASELTFVPSNDTAVSKPQVVTTALKSKADIAAYTVTEGDSISSIATKFGVTSDSIRWSNGMTGEVVNTGTSLTIPPVNGIVHTVVSGDNADKLAAKFKANKDQIIAYNDAEIDGLVVGEKIIIPNGTITPVTPVPARVIASASRSVGFAFGNSATYGYNGYDYGYCTWYVASHISVPSNWGNANTWDNLAPLSGWTVSNVPTAGSIGQTNRGSEGHVAVVTAVREDGFIKYSDMNGLAGWGREGSSDWVSPAKFENFIRR